MSFEEIVKKAEGLVSLKAEVKSALSALKSDLQKEHDLVNVDIRKLTSEVTKLENSIKTSLQEATRSLSAEAIEIVSKAASELKKARLAVETTELFRVNNTIQDKISKVEDLLRAI